MTYMKLFYSPNETNLVIVSKTREFTYGIREFNLNLDLQHITSAVVQGKYVTCTSISGMYGVNRPVASPPDLAPPDSWDMDKRTQTAKAPETST